MKYEVDMGDDGVVHLDALGFLSAAEMAVAQHELSRLEYPIASGSQEIVVTVRRCGSTMPPIRVRVGGDPSPQYWSRQEL